MRFLVDECTGPAVAEWLHNQKHEVFSVFDEARGMDDDDIALKALEENWISEKKDIEMADFTGVSSYFALKMNVLHQNPGTSPSSHGIPRSTVKHICCSHGKIDSFCPKVD